MSHDKLDQLIEGLAAAETNAKGTA
jgi:hypothetical protein